MLKKLSAVFLSLLFLLLLARPTFAQEKEVNIYFFWGEGCPHCASEQPFLEKLENKYSEVKVYEYETWKSSENRQLLINVGKKLNIKVSGVPFTVVGEKHFTGWLSEETTGKDIETAVLYALTNNPRDVVGEVLSKTSLDTPTQLPPEIKKTNEAPLVKTETSKNSAIPKELDLPIFGTINTQNLSLPVLTIVLGGLDGFNPCAMWTLLFLISLLLGMKDKKRRWILGSAFIISSAFVYFLFMAAWLNLLLFIGFIVWVRIIIGLIAIAGGGYNLKEFITNKDNACKVTGGEKRQKVFGKLKEITHQKQFIVALGGIIVLAFAVNLVELICSAGLPVVFTQILTLSGLSSVQYYAYMLLYIFVFMLDDLFIFFTAMITLEMTGISTKYSRASHLIGGVLMLTVGLLLIFKPEVLMLG